MSFFPKQWIESYCDRQINESKTEILEQVDNVISTANRNHANIFDREIRAKSLNMSQEGSTKNLNMNNFRIVVLPDLTSKMKASRLIFVC